MKPINIKPKNDFFFDYAVGGLPGFLALAGILLSFYKSLPRLSISLLFFCSLILLIKYLKRDQIGRAGIITFLAAFTFWYSYPGCISFLLPKYSLEDAVYGYINEKILLLAVIYLSVFLLSALTFLKLTKSQNDYGVRKLEYRLKVKRRYRAKTSGRWVIRVSLCGAGIGLIPYIVLGGPPSQIVRSILESRAVDKPWFGAGNLGNSITPFTYIASCLLVASTSLLWVAVTDKNIRPLTRTISGIVALTLSMIIFFDNGTRSLTALIVIPAAVLFMVDRWKRSHYQTIIIILMCVFASIFILQFQAIYRASFSRPYLDELLYKDWFTLGGSLDFFKETIYAIKIVPTYHAYFKESAILLGLISPIPRFIWPEKPISQVVRFYTLERWNRDIVLEAGNTFPGIVGQYYMSWGWLGPIFVGIILGLFLKKIGSLREKAKQLNDRYYIAIWDMWLIWVFLSFRLLGPAYLYPVLGAMLILWIARSLNGRRPLYMVKNRKSCSHLFNTYIHKPISLYKKQFL